MVAPHESSRAHGAPGFDTLLQVQQMVRTLPGVIWPAASAPSIMALPMRSLTLEHGSMLSSLAATRAPAPLPSLFRYTMGVLPADGVGELLVITFMTHCPLTPVMQVLQDQ